MPKNKRKAQLLANFRGKKGGRRPRSLLVLENVDGLAMQMDSAIHNDSTNDDREHPIDNDFTNDLNDNGNDDDDMATDTDYDFAARSVPQPQRSRVEPRFIRPVITYDPSKQSYVIAEEFDEERHGPLNSLHQLFGVCWINTDEVDQILRDGFVRDDFVQSTVSHTRTGDIVEAATNLSRAKRLTPYEFHERRQRRPTSHFVGCPSIIKFKEEGHTVVPESAFAIPIWATSHEIALNIELRIRDKVGAIRSRVGLLAEGFLDGVDVHIEAAIWNTINEWAHINEHHFRYG